MKNDNMNSKLESASYGSDGSDKNSIPVSVFYAKSILLNSVLSRTNSDKKNSDSKTVSNTSHTSYRHNDNDKPLTLSEERLEEMKFVPISNDIRRRDSSFKYWS